MLSKLWNAIPTVVFTSSLVSLSAIAAYVSWTCNDSLLISRGARVGRAAAAAVGNGFYLVWAITRECTRGRRKWLIMAAAVLVALAVASGVIVFQPAAGSSPGTPVHHVDVTLNPEQTNRVVLIGDSNTNYGFYERIPGWAVLLARKYTTLAWENQGYPGYTTASIRPVVEHTILPKLDAKTRLVTICLGTNDAYAYGLPYLDTYRENLRRFVQQIRAASPQTTILLLTPPIVTGPSPASAPYAYRLIETFGEAVLRLAAEEKVDVVDLFHSMSRSDVGPDGLHFGTVGNQRIYEVVSAKIAPLWGLPPSGN